MFKKFINDRQKLLLTISFRNLVRQKRRNLLLGLVIAIGMMFLVMANSWAHGITDLLLNKLMVYAFGHVQVTQTERGKYQQDIIRDKDRWLTIINKNMKDVKQVNESCASFTRLIGKGKAEMIAIVGIAPERFKNDGFGGMVSVEGKMTDFTNTQIENPIMIYEDKAKEINVHVGDFVKARLTTIHGQQQTARFQVVAVLKSIGFMQSMASYVPLKNLKFLLGYQPWESGALQIVLKKPKTSVAQANRLFAAIKPGYAVIEGKLTSGNLSGPVSVLSYYNKPDVVKQVGAPAINPWQQKRGGRSFGKSKEIAEKSLKTNATLPAALALNSRDILMKELKVVSGSLDANTNTKMVAVSSVLAKNLGLRPGSPVVFSYSNKFGGIRTSHPYKVSCIYEDGGKLPTASAFIAEKNFNDTWYDNLPASSGAGRQVVATNSPFAGILMKESLLMRRSASMDDMQKKFKVITKAKLKVGLMDVSTMYETFDVIIKMESTISLITGIMVLILFVVILVGVVNTLNLTIRERTREIGTVRSIGMQQGDVRDTFLLEVVMLGAFACVAGTIAAFILMGLLSLIPINTTSMFSMFLNERHLHFVPVFGNLAIVIWLAAFFWIIYQYIGNVTQKIKPLQAFLAFIGLALVSMIVKLLATMAGGVGFQAAMMQTQMSLGGILGLGILAYVVSFIVFGIKALFKIPIDDMRSYFADFSMVAFCVLFVVVGATSNEIIPALLVIVMLTFVTAYFPSRRASNMSAASALRHYE